MVAICTILCALSGVCASAGADEIAKPNVKSRNPLVVVTKVKVVPYNNKYQSESLCNQYQEMISAINSGNVIMIDKLISGGFDINTVMLVTHSYSNPFYTPVTMNTIGNGGLTLSSIVTRRNTQGIREWFAPWNGRYLLDRSVSGYVYGTPLMVACKARNPVLVKKLLELGANPNIWIRFKDSLQEPGGYYPRPYVSAYSSLWPFPPPKEDKRMAENEKVAEINELLKQAGAMFPMELDDFGRSALWDAYESGQAFWLKYLLEHEFVVRENGVKKTIKLDPKKRTGSGDSFLDFMATRDQASPMIREMVQTLREHGYELPVNGAEAGESGNAGGGAGGLELIEIK